MELAKYHFWYYKRLFSFQKRNISYWSWRLHQNRMSSPGLFDAFRSNGAPTYYDSNKTPFMADILESGLIYAFVIVAFSFFIILPGIRGKEVNSTGLYPVASCRTLSTILERSYRGRRGRDWYINFEYLTVFSKKFVIKSTDIKRTLLK